LIAAVAAAIMAVAAAAWLRIAGGIVHPLWLDEAYSAYAAAHDWTFLWTVVPRYETHPPFYYSLLRAWTLVFGDSLVGLRSLGLVASLLTLPVVALAARELGRILRGSPEGGHSVPLAALLLIAFAPFPLEIGQQVRPYAVQILVYAVACLALLRIGRETAAGAGIRLRPLALYLVTLALMLWLHNLGLLYAVAMSLALVVLVLRWGLTARDWTRLAIGHVAVGLAYLPALLILIDQAPTWVQSTWLRFTTEGLQWRLASMYLMSNGRVLIAAGLLGLAALVLLGRNDAGRRTAAALLLLAIVPVALSILLSMRIAPVFIPRTMAAAGIPLLLLLAGGAGGGGWLRAPAWAALTFVLVQMAWFDWRTTPGRPQEDWYAAARWVGSRYRAGDIVYAYPNESALPFDYAVRDLGLAMPTWPIPTPVPSIGIAGAWYPTGSRGVVSLPRPALQAIARSPETRAAPTVWLLRSGAWTYDKGDVFLNELARGRKVIGRYRRGPIDIIGLSLGRGGPAGAGAAR
jgi:hypothetical protein